MNTMEYKGFDIDVHTYGKTFTVFVFAHGKPRKDIDDMLLGCHDISTEDKAFTYGKLWVESHLTKRAFDEAPETLREKEPEHTNVYRIELMIIDHDQVGAEEIRHILENNHYPNHCIAPQVKKMEARDLGVWTDEHPLNKKETATKEYNRLFSICNCSEGYVCSICMNKKVGHD